MTVKQLSLAYRQGVDRANRSGSWIFDCPYCAGEERQEYDDWIKGFRDRRAEQELESS